MNATVSHEMRNPLNSIIAENLKLHEKVKKIEALVNVDKKRSTKLKNNVLEIVMEMKESIDIQYSSTKLLNFSVNDMLSLAQLNSSKFRKEYCMFDIRDSI